MVDEKILSINFPLSIITNSISISVKNYGFKISNAGKEGDCFTFSVFDSKCQESDGNGNYKLKVR